MFLRQVALQAGAQSPSCPGDGVSTGSTDSTVRLDPQTAVQPCDPRRNSERHQLCRTRHTLQCSVVERTDCVNEICAFAYALQNKYK
jgi:hypothetical protein